MLIANARQTQPLRDRINRERMYRSLQFLKRSQLFIRTHDETFSVAVHVHNSNRSVFAIQR
jgi:hypothetical protein